MPMDLTWNDESRNENVGIQIFSGKLVGIATVLASQNHLCTKTCEKWLRQVWIHGYIAMFCSLLNRS